MVGRLFMSGRPSLRHSAMVAVRTNSFCEVMSQAMQSLVCAPHEDRICSANFTLR